MVARLQKRAPAPVGRLIGAAVARWDTLTPKLKPRLRTILRRVKAKIAPPRRVSFDNPGAPAEGNLATPDYSDLRRLRER